MSKVKISIVYLVEEDFLPRWSKMHSIGEHDTNGTEIVGFEVHDEDEENEEGDTWARWKYSGDSNE